MVAKSGSCFQQLAGCGSLFSQQAFKKQAKPRIRIERENETIGRCITNTPGLLRAMAKASEDAMNVHDCPDADKRRNGLSGHEKSPVGSQLETVTKCFFSCFPPILGIPLWKSCND